MNTFTVELQIPDALQELGYGPEEICREVPTLLVLKRFREGVVSSGTAAEILGMSLRDFLDLLAKEQIPVYDQSDAEFAAELNVAFSGRRANLGLSEEAWPTTPAGIAALLARMDKVEPGWLSPEDDADWHEQLRAQKEREKTAFFDQAEELRKMWE